MGAASPYWVMTALGGANDHSDTFCGVALDAAALLQVVNAHHQRPTMRQSFGTLNRQIKLSVLLVVTLSGCGSAPTRYSDNFTPEDSASERRAANARFEALRQANEAMQEILDARRRASPAAAAPSTTSRGRSGKCHPAGNGGNICQ